jgi:hypothetical protein
LQSFKERKDKNMKKQTLIICAAILFTVASCSLVFGQDKKMDGMKMTDKTMMAEMMKSPHHQMMTAHRQTVVTFAAALRIMAADSKKFDRDFARDAFSEIKRGAEMTDGVHQKHQATMSAEMRPKMAVMMEKMSKNQTGLKEHIAALETLLQTDAPNLKNVETHAAAIVSQFEKMKMPEGKMKM